MSTNYFSDGMRDWTLAEIYADLVTKEDIARIFDVNRFRVYGWCQRKDRLLSPEPVRKFGTLNVYSMQEWRAWRAQFEAKKRPDTKWTDDAAVYDTDQPFFPRPKP